MTGPDPIGTAGRVARRQQRLAGAHECVLCGEMRAAALHKRSGHHVAGRANDSLAVVICLNCHEVAGDDLRALGVPMRPRENRAALDRTVAVLRGLGSFNLLQGERLIELANELETDLRPSEEA